MSRQVNFRETKIYPSSVGYHEHLIDFLSNPQMAAMYLEDILQDNDGEPRLLALGMKNVTEALGSQKMSLEEVKQHQEKIEKLLQLKGVDFIYELMAWLDTLGLKLGVMIKEEKLEQAQANLAASVATTQESKGDVGLL